MRVKNCESLRRERDAKPLGAVWIETGIQCMFRAIRLPVEHLSHRIIAYQSVSARCPSVFRQTSKANEFVDSKFGEASDEFARAQLD